MRQIFQERVTQSSIFDAPAHLYHKADPISSKISASNVKHFKPSHETIIRDLLTEHPNRTSKELASLCSLNHIQIDRRIFAMKDVVRDENLIRGGCHPLRLV